MQQPEECVNELAGLTKKQKEREKKAKQTSGHEIPIFSCKSWYSTACKPEAGYKNLQINRCV